MNPKNNAEQFTKRNNFVVKTNLSEHLCVCCRTKARIGLADRRSASSETDTGDETVVAYTLEKTKKFLSTSKEI